MGKFNSGLYKHVEERRKSDPVYDAELWDFFHENRKWLRFRLTVKYLFFFFVSVLSLTGLFCLLHPEMRMALKMTMITLIEQLAALL